MGRPMEKHLKCPWCGKGEILADGTAKILVSVKCPKCGHIFTGDLDTMKTKKSMAQRRLCHSK
jgi:DNA polymerase III, alpha subunit (gram-positive type)